MKKHISKVREAQSGYAITWKTLFASGGCSSCLLFAIFLLAGCGGVTVAGLRPVYPPLEKNFFAVFTNPVEVDSLQPTFRWQNFPRNDDPFVDKVQNVTYELRIWQPVPGSTGKLRYKRDGLELNSHTLEEPLEPSRQYYWSVRARFLIDGDLRVTEWGMAGLPLRNESTEGNDER